MVHVDVSGHWNLHRHSDHFHFRHVNDLHATHMDGNGHFPHHRDLDVAVLLNVLGHLDRDPHHLGVIHRHRNLDVPGVVHGNRDLPDLGHIPSLVYRDVHRDLNLLHHRDPHVFVPDHRDLDRVLDVDRHLFVDGHLDVFRVVHVLGHLDGHRHVDRNLPDHGDLHMTGVVHGHFDRNLHHAHTFVVMVVVTRIICR